MRRAGQSAAAGLLTGACGVLQARTAGVKTAVIAGAGHMVSMEKPAEFNRAVLEFLNGLPAR